MSDLLSWPGLAFGVYVAGYFGLAYVMAQVLREEGVEAPPQLIAMAAILLMIWPVFWAWSAVDAIKNRDQ